MAVEHRVDVGLDLFFLLLGVLHTMWPRCLDLVQRGR